MGFGYVFIGTLLFFNIPYHSFTDVFAVAMMLWGLSMLAPYAKGFAIALRAGMPYLAVCLIAFLLAILDLVGLWSLPTLVSLTAAVGIVCKLFFLWFFFVGVDEVARETDILKLRRHALRTRFLTPVFCFAGLLMELGIFAQHTEFLKYYLLGYLLFGVIYAFFVSKTVYECYMMICYEGDEDMGVSLPTPKGRNKK